MTKPTKDGIRDTFDIQSAIDGARKLAKRRSYIFDKDFSNECDSEAATREQFTFTIDGVEVPAKSGQTIMEAADAAGIYIPRLCDHEGLRHQGGCRVCTVKAADAAFRPAPSRPAPAPVVENRRRRTSPSCGAISSRCSSTKATTFARCARRAAIASCRPWPIGST